MMIFLAPLRWLRRLFRPRPAGGAVTIPDRRAVAARAARLMNMTLYLQRARDLGLRARLARTVRRDPYIVVRAGETGEILDPLSDPIDNRFVIRVRMDHPPEGIEEFNGELHWKEDVNLEDFEKDVAFFRPAL